MAGAFVGGQVLGGVVGGFGGREGDAGAELEEGDDFFVAFDGAADYGGAQDGGMRVEDGFDFGGIDVEAEADDEFFGASDDKEVAVAELGEVTGIEPAFAIDCGGGFFRSAVVALHHVGSADPEFADFAGRDRIFFAIDEFHFDTRENAADGGVGARLIGMGLGDIRANIR